MQRCFADKAAFQNIRCAAVTAGGCTFHTHRTIHWGNRGRPTWTGCPRIALSFGFSTPDFEPPYFKPKHLPFPALELRLALMSAQVLNYATLAAGDEEGWVALAGSMAGCNASTLNMLHRLFQRRIKAFHPTYRKEIARKFVRVSLDLGRGGCLSSASTSCAQTEEISKNRTNDAQAGGRGESKNNSDDEDDALEAMLSAEADCGEVLFHDDFDMLNGGSCAEADFAGLAGRRRKKNRERRHQSLKGSQADVAQHAVRTTVRKKRRR